MVNALVFKDRLHYDIRYADPVPHDGEVLVPSSWPGICATDLEIVRGYMGFTGVPGHEFVGAVVSGPRSGRVSAAWWPRSTASAASANMCQRGLANHCRDGPCWGSRGATACSRTLWRCPSGNFTPCRIRSATSRPSSSSLWAAAFPGRQAVSDREAQ